jgi:ABC-type phosphate/phosphonate transport system substrate-binding protein
MAEPADDHHRVVLLVCSANASSAWLCWRWQPVVRHRCQKASQRLALFVQRPSSAQIRKTRHENPQATLATALLTLSALACAEEAVLKVSAIPDEAPTELQRKFAPLGQYLEKSWG